MACLNAGLRTAEVKPVHMLHNIAPRCALLPTSKTNLARLAYNKAFSTDKYTPGGSVVQKAFQCPPWREM